MRHRFLLEAKGDLDIATARLLGLDMGIMLTRETFLKLETILEKETKSSSRCIITHELSKYFNGDFKESRKCLSSLLKGMIEGYEDTKKALPAN